MSDLDSTNQTDGLSYRSQTTPLHVWHDSTTAGSISTTVVTAVAKARSADPTDMPPIYEFVDPDALDKLIGDDVDYPVRFDGYVTFTYAGYSVTIYSDGEIVVHDLDAN